MTLRRPDSASERRLDALRREAEEKGVVQGGGVRPAGAPMPEASGASGYYGLPLLKPPVWTWEVPAYFFVGGTAGAAACIALAANFTGGDPRLVRRAQWLAAGGAAISGPLLIADLGRPERFLNMLRVFKPQSPMSVGAWLLAAFSVTSAATIVTRGRLRAAAGSGAALTGLGMATYTGVLVGATAIPVWARHATLIPAHFGASALGSAAAALELLGHSRDAGLQNVARAAAAAETAITVYLESRRDRDSALLQEGRTGMTSRLAGAFSGPIPLLIRFLHGRSRRARKAAAVATLLGSVLTRLAWVEAGRASAARSSAGGDYAEATQRVPDNRSGSESRPGSAAIANPTPAVSSER